MRNKKVTDKIDDASKKDVKSSSRRGKNRNSSKKYVAGKKPARELDATGRDNDPNWYFSSPELADQASQLSFQNVLGYGDVEGFAIPTIARIDLVGCPGMTYSVSPFAGSHHGRWSDLQIETVNGHIKGGKAAVNLMAAKLYTTLSSFTGRTASYAPQDIAMMILAISAIAEFSEAIRRAFGIALTYNFRNRTLPLGLIASMGLDTDDFISQLSVYRMKFNICMSRINQVPLLENIAYIKKARDIYQRIYMDDATSMSQLFYYMPATVAILDEVGDEDGSVLRHFRLNGDDSKTMAHWLDILDSMITNILESSTMNFIYADLLNMANKLNVETWKFDYLAENYVVMPEFNRNAHIQFHNTTFTGSAINVHEYIEEPESVPKKFRVPSDMPNVYVTEGYDVFCSADKNNIVYNPMFEQDLTVAAPMFAVIDMDTDNPSIEDRIEALRYASCFTGFFDTTDGFGDSDLPAGTLVQSFVALPDHFAEKVVIYANISDSEEYNSNHTIPGNWFADTSSYVMNLSALTQWEHAPLVGVTNHSTGDVASILGDLKYYTTVDVEYIFRLLNLTYVGLFDFRVR